MGLSDARAVAEPDWVEVVWAVMSIATENGYPMKGRALVHSFSQKAETEYSERGVDEKLDGLRQRSALERRKNFNSIKKWLKEDNAEVYEELCGAGRDYASVKARFEETHFKVEEPLLFVTVLSGGRNSLKKRSEFKDTYENVYFRRENKKGVMEEVPFVSEWFKDKSIRTYKKMDFLPPPCEVEEGTSTYGAACEWKSSWSCIRRKSQGRWT